MSKDQEQFQWTRHPKSEGLILGALNDAVNSNSFLRELERDFNTVTSSRLLDWVDHITLPETEELKSTLESYGFEAFENTAYRHPGAQLPMVLLSSTATHAIAIKLEYISDFLLVRGLKKPIEGSPFAPFRRCTVDEENGVEVQVIERRGTRSMQVLDVEPDYLSRYFQAEELWASRPRYAENQELLMAETLEIAGAMAKLVGKDIAAHIALEQERKYWQARNEAGALQKNRQDQLGVGWANHDHHTFRSSRKQFRGLVQLMQTFGFHCRERFYAGLEAGWGAQVMENTNSGLILFLDVDLDPEEVAQDFAEIQLPDVDHVGTIGLWCELHGDSIFSAGMHHLEGQFLFDELREDLDEIGIGMMQPFSNFDYLKQAFTEGEIWTVDPKNVQSLFDRGLISKEEAEKFLAEGAVGSHLENLQRREGFKGFNQKNVSFIIKKTDPRSIELN